MRAFCPVSQIDIARTEPSAHIGKVYAFRIAEHKEGGRNLIVSRRALLEEQQRANAAEVRKSIVAGAVVTGRVVSVREFGAFVDLGGGVQGLLHVSEMGWSRVSDPSRVVKPGDEITVKVLRVDDESGRIALGLKQLTPDPWSKVGDTYEVGQVDEIRAALGQPVGGSAQYRVQLHERIRGEAHTGDGCERLRIVGEGGSEAWIAHAVGRPRVIDDLLPTLWIKADRPGIQLAARIVLPRSLNPRSRQPLTAVVYGSSYTTVGRWQQLRLEDIPRLLTRETRALRTEYGPSVDPREAYVEQILLNIYGGPGVTNVWIDDLDIAGWATAPSTPPPAQTGPAPAARRWFSATGWVYRTCFHFGWSRLWSSQASSP